jgi:hypothetical protein
MGKKLGASTAYVFSKFAKNSSLHLCNAKNFPGVLPPYPFRGKWGKGEGTGRRGKMEGRMKDRKRGKGVE